MTERLSKDQIEQRIPIWSALSDLWLDNEMDDFDFQRIAKEIAHSSFSFEECVSIHKYEVVPAVSYNLKTVVGIWQGFDKEWLKEECLRFANQRSNKFHRFKCLLLTPRIIFFRGGHLKKIRQFYAEIEQEAE